MEQLAPKQWPSHEHVGGGGVLPAVPQMPPLHVRSSEQSSSVLQLAPAQWPSHEHVGGGVVPPPPKRAINWSPIVASELSNAEKLVAFLRAGC